jgi:hypothetical protein
MKLITKQNQTLATTPAANSQSAWAARGEIWRGRVERASVRRTKRAKPLSALILTGHGVSLRIHGGALEIKNGLTIIRNSGKHICFSAATPTCPNE